MTTSTARRRRTALLVGAAALTAGSWAATGQGAGATTVPDDAAASDGSTAAIAQFPVTLDTAYGEITVERKPERIVVVNDNYLELLALLGETPIVANVSDEDIAAYQPWLEGIYDGERDLELFTAEYLASPEAIAVWEPDLILTTIWTIDEPIYEQLSQIAPTYAGIATDTNTSWQENLTALATLTGNDPAILDEVQADVDAEFAAAAERLPGLQGATYQVAALGGDEQLWLTEYANEPLLALGLVAGEGQPLEGSQALTAPRFSLENVDQLTAEVLVLATLHRDPAGEWQAKLDADPRVPELPSAQNGTLIFPTSAQWVAINGGSPASYSWWLGEVMPQLEASALNQSGQ